MNTEGKEVRLNILLTGGHAATTAISVIEETKKEYPHCKLFWVGPRSAVEGKYVPTLASTIFPKMGVIFVPITTGRLQRKFTIWTIPSLIKIPMGILQAIKIISKIKPKIIISFGGYASVPICFVGWTMRIPIIVHEQTVAVGRANKFNEKFATKILIAREESERYFSSGETDKTILVGNPVSEGILKVRPKRSLSKVPTIFITGGSSGAQRINDVIRESLYELLKKYKVIHLTGKLDFDKFEKMREDFPSDLRNKYEVYGFIDPKEMPGYFEKADIVISRAGANTLSEIMIAKRPAILIPIPWTAYDEQTKNARLVEKTGIGIVLPEKSLTEKNLMEKIDFVAKNWKKMVENSDPVLAQLDKNAARRFVEEIKRFIG